MLVLAVCGKDKLTHLGTGNGQRGILLMIVRLKMVVIEAQPRQFRRLLDVSVGLLCSGIGKDEVGNQVFQVALAFSLDILLYVFLGNVGIGAIIDEIVGGLVLTTVRGPKYVPFLLWRLYISYRHPCFGANSFGEGIGGKANAARVCLASTSFHIRQCAHYHAKIRRITQTAKKLRIFKKDKGRYTKEEPMWTPLSYVMRCSYLT